jgi:hypothetical protein
MLGEDLCIVEAGNPRRMGATRPEIAEESSTASGKTRATRTLMVEEGRMSMKLTCETLKAILQT